MPQTSVKWTPPQAFFQQYCNSEYWKNTRICVNNSGIFGLALGQYENMPYGEFHVIVKYNQKVGEKLCDREFIHEQLFVIH